MSDEQSLADDAFRRRDLATAADHLHRHLRARPADLHAWMKLATIQRTAGRAAEALDAIDRALAIEPLFYLALLMKATLLEARGDADRAAELYAAARFHQPERDVPRPVLDQLARGQAFIDARASAVKIEAEQACHRSGITDQDAVIRTFIDTVYRNRPVYHQEPTHYRWPGLADTEFFDDYDPDWINQLETLTDVIRDEFETVMAQGRTAADPYVRINASIPVGQWRDLNNSPDWSAVHLLRYGQVQAEAARHCPETLRAFGLSERQPQISRLAPNLMFSILAPRTHIPPHHGVANFRSVLHLPLIVPDGCRFRVGAETRQWKTGKAWVFDDTIEHEAWNDSDAPRVILIADIWRPELSPSARKAIINSLGALSITSDLSL